MLMIGMKRNNEEPEGHTYNSTRISYSTTMLPLKEYATWTATESEGA